MARSRGLGNGQAVRSLHCAAVSVTRGGRLRFGRLATWMDGVTHGYFAKTAVPLACSLLRAINDSTLCHLDRSAAEWRDLRFNGPCMEMFLLFNHTQVSGCPEPLHHTLLAERAHNRKQTWRHTLSRERNP
jgi:hypothetical protein